MPVSLGTKRHRIKLIVTGYYTRRACLARRT